MSQIRSSLDEFVETAGADLPLRGSGATWPRLEVLAGWTSRDLSLCKTAPIRWSGNECASLGSCARRVCRGATPHRSNNSHATRYRPPSRAFDERAASQRGEFCENALHALEEITSEFQVHPFSASGLTPRVSFKEAIGLLIKRLNEGDV